MPTPNPSSNRGNVEFAATLAHYQRRADSAFQLHGLAAPAPGIGESLSDYRTRLLSNLAPYSSPQYRAISFHRMKDDATIGNFEKLLIDGAITNFKRPEGPLRPLVRRDAADRKIIEWYGDERECWKPFANGGKPGKINFEMCTGKNAPGARQPVATVMSDGTTVPIQK